MTNFIGFCVKMTGHTIVAGLSYACILFVLYDHPNNAPAFYRGALTAFELLACMFAGGAVGGAFLAIVRFIFRNI